VGGFREPRECVGRDGDIRQRVTSADRIEETKFNTVKPHPDAILKVYQVKQFRENLKSLKVTPR
jgi:hypothetical protein